MPRWGCGGVFNFELIEERPGFLSFRATGKKVEAAFANEAGGHRIQQIPPTERKGRIHTSTITVAVLVEAKPTEFQIHEKDLDYKCVRSSGAGGQNVNKVSSAVQLTYLPTGFMVRCESQRSQLQNKETALLILRTKLLAAKASGELAAHNAMRKGQIGSGQRADKRRTVAHQRGDVHDHVTGKRMELARYLKGFLEDLD